jgi:cupin fold WbuC family metalloprotein
MTPDTLIALRAREESPEVLYPLEPVVHLRREGIEILTKAAATNPRERIRLCTHSGVGDSLHEMFIVHRSGTYIRPHRHPGKSESFHVIDGTADVVLFDDNGGIRDVIPTGPYSSGRCFYQRLSVAVYHTLIIRSQAFIFHEVTSGPFDRASSEFAPWSPAIDAGQDEIAAFTARIEDGVRIFLESASPA